MGDIPRMIDENESLEESIENTIKVIKK